MENSEISTLTEEQIKARRQYVDKCREDKLEEQLSEAVQHTIETHASKKDPEVSPAQAVAQHLLRVACPGEPQLNDYKDLANEAKQNVKAPPDDNSGDAPWTLRRLLSQTDVASEVGQIIGDAMIHDDVDELRHRLSSPPPFPRAVVSLNTSDVNDCTKMQKERQVRIRT